MVLKVILKLICENGWLSHTYLLLLKKKNKRKLTILKILKNTLYFNFQLYFETIVEETKKLFKGGHDDDTQT